MNAAIASPSVMALTQETGTVAEMRLAGATPVLDADADAEAAAVVVVEPAPADVAVAAASVAEAVCGTEERVTSEVYVADRPVAFLQLSGVDDATPSVKFRAAHFQNVSE